MRLRWLQRSGTDGRPPVGLRVLLALLVLLGPAAPAGRAAETLLDKWNLHPGYETGYDVSRQQETWKQKLTFDRKSRLADLKSRMESLDREDPSRNDYVKKQRVLNFNLERTRGSLRLFSTGTVDRVREDRTNTTGTSDRDILSLGSDLNLLKRAAATLKATATGGWVRTGRIDIRRRATGFLADSSEASGLQGALGLAGKWSRGTVFNLTADARVDRARKRSETVHEELAGETLTSTLKAATDNDRTVTYSVGTEWTRFEAAKLSVKNSYSDGTSQYYQASQQDQETRRNRRSALGVIVEGLLSPTFYYTLDAHHKSNLVDFDLEQRDQDDSDTDLGLEVGYKLERVPWSAVLKPILGGTELIGTISLGDGVRNVQTGVDYRTERGLLGGELRRDFSEEFSTSLKSELQLNQDFYEDPTLDQDILTLRSHVSARYTPSDGFRSSITYRIDTRETINISGAKSAGNQEREDYSIIADYNAALPAGIQARQSFQIQAAYQSYTYAQQQNSLARTNRVATALEIPFMERTLVSLKHDFLRTDTGSYVYDDGTRAYSKEIERLQQRLHAVATYDLTEEIYARAEERYEITYNEALATGVRSRIDTLTWTWEVGFRRQFPSGFKVDAVVARTASNREDNYWNIRADAGMRF